MKQNRKLFFEVMDKINYYNIALPDISIVKDDIFLSWLNNNNTCGLRINKEGINMRAIEQGSKNINDWHSVDDAIFMLRQTFVYKMDY